MKRGKRYVDSAKKIDRTVQYESADAIKLVKENEMCIRDRTHCEQMLKAIPI